MRPWALALSASLALIGVRLVTVERRVGDGGEDCWQYGFPLAYTQDFSGTSLYTLLYAPALVVDWLVYAVPIAAVIVLVARRRSWRSLPTLARFGVVAAYVSAALIVFGEACWTSPATQMPSSEGAAREWVLRF